MYILSCSVSNTLQPHRLDSPGSSVHGAFQARILEWTSHFLLQVISLTQVSNSNLLCFLEWQVGSLTTVPPGKPLYLYLDINYFVISVGNANFKYVPISNIHFYFFSVIFTNWRLITLQYCSGSCHTLTWISHGFTYVPHPNPPSHLPLHSIPLGLPSAPGLSTCLIHPTWAGDLFHPR